MYDGSDLPLLTEQLAKAEEALEIASRDVPTAIKSQKFSLRTMEWLESSFMVKELKGGVKPDLAKKLAQANPDFQAQAKELMDLFEIAETTIQKHKQAEKHWETARSLLSAAKGQGNFAYNRNQ